MSAPAEPAVTDWPFDARRIPYEYFEELRSGGKVQHLPGTNMYVAGRWEDLTEIAQQAEVFTQDLSEISPEFRRTVTPCPFEHAPRTKYVPSPTPFSDGEDHKIKRRWGLRMVQPDRLRSYEPLVTALCDELIDAFIARGRCEFRTDFAIPLPTRVVGMLLGVPKDEASRFVEWADAIFLAGLLGAPEEHRRMSEQAWREMYDYVSDAVIERFKHPQDDFLSELVRVQVEQDGGLDLNYQIVQASNIIQAGSETTVNMLCNAMLYTARDAGVRERLQADPKLIPGLIEETMRLESPVSLTFRLCRQDTEVNGVEIPAGSLVVMLWAAGNRDAERFEEPEELVLDRPRVMKDQLAFGRGAHRCLGAPLARLEGKIAFERLLTRLGEIRLVDDGTDLRNVESARMHGPRSLVIEFDGRG
jgi:cytochrome P450